MEPVQALTESPASARNGTATAPEAASWLLHPASPADTARSLADELAAEPQFTGTDPHGQSWKDGKPCPSPR